MAIELNSTGATAAAIQRKLGLLVSVDMYGAVGDGTTDDTSAVAAALAVVNASGGTLYFQAGKTYKIAASLNITHDDVTISGYGATLDILKDGTATGRSLKATSCARFKVYGLRITCSTSAARNQVYGMLSLFTVTDFVIRDVVITSGEGVGVYTEVCQRGLIDNVRVTGVKADGIHISRGSLDVAVNNCHIDAVADDGIAVASVENDGATLYDPCARITISDCTIQNLITTGAGIAVNGGDDITISGCIAHNPINHGYQVDGAQFHPTNRVNISNCHARDIDAAKYAFNIATAIDTSIVGCTARDIANPVVIAASTRTLVSSCNFEGSAIGVYDDSASSATYVIGNYLEGSGTTTSLEGTGSIAVTRQPAPSLGTVGGPPKIIWKTADETVNNSAAYQDDNHLILPVGTNQKWVGEFYLFVAGDATADFRFNITVPAGASGRRSAAHPRTTDTLWQTYQAPTITTAETAIGNQAAGMLVVIPFYLATAGTAGNMTLQWCQDVATVADTTVMLGSYLTAHRVA